MKKKILVMVSFLVLFLLSFRFFFQTQGIIGHNWDWGFPSMNIFSEKLNILSIFTWNNYNLGKVADLTIVHLFPTSLFVLISKLLGIKMLLFLLFFSVVFVSFVSFKKLLDFLLGKSFLNYIFSFLYTYSPFLFNDIISGAWIMWVSYSLCPIYFVFVLKYLKTNGIKYLLLSLLISIFTIISFQYFVLINLLISLYLIYEIVIVKNEEFKNIINKLFIFLILMILINTYWILPFSYTFTNFTRNVILLDGDTHAFDPIRNSTQSIWNIFNLGGYHDRNMYLHALPFVLKCLFQLTVGLAWLVVLKFFILEKNRIIRQKVIFWMLSLLVLIIIVKGGNSPFPQLTLWLSYSFPLMKLFRNPLHLMLIPAFIIPVLLAFSLSYFYKNLKFKKAVLIISTFIVAIWISGWWYNGDLGHKTLLGQKRDHVDFYQLPPELIKYYEKSQSDKLDYRSFFLPAVLSPMFLKTEYQNMAQGNQPEYAYLNKPTFNSESNKFADSIEISFCKEIGFDYIRYLSLFSVKNIILRSDIYPLFTKSANCWDDDFVRARLDSSVFLEKFLTGRYASAYKIKDDYYLPHFYIPQNIIYSSSTIEALPEIVGFGDYEIRSGIYLNDINELTNSKINELEELKERADEIFVKGELEDKVSEEELGMIVKPEEMSLPYVRQKPGSLFYFLVLKKEEYDKWQTRREPEKLFEKHLFYASKRVSEIMAFGVNKSILINYKEEMTNALEILKKLKQEGSKDFVNLLTKYEGTLWGQRSKINELTNYSLTDWDNTFKELEGQAEELKIKRDFSQLVYKIEIPKEGEYEIYFRGGSDTENKILDIGSKEEINEDWVKLGERYFGSGAQNLTLPMSGVSENLVDENLRIKNYAPDSIYRISFDYQAPRGGSFFVAEGKTGELAETNIPSTDSELKHFEMFFRSSAKAEEADIHLSLSIAQEKNLKVERIYQPEVILKNVKYQISNVKYQIPKITFVKINPTKYRVKVENAKEPYTLVFSESFHQGWKAYVSQQATANSQQQYGETVASYFDGEIKEGTHRNTFLERATFETWSEKPLPEEKHLLVNDYANSWYITPEDANGQENYELIIEFWPQRLFYLGLGISLAALLVCLGYLGIGFFKNSVKLKVR